jgi:hypothetical protein
MHIFKGLLYQRAMQVFTRKILASIGLFIVPLLGFGQSTYTLVTSAEDLTVGAKYIIVGEKNGAYKAMGKQTPNNNRKAVEVSVSNKTVTAICATTNNDDDADNVYEFTLGGNNTNGWTFLDGTLNEYLYAASSSSNQLKSQSNIDDNALWSITIDNDDYCSIIAKGTNTRNIIRYNSTSSLFSCYGSTSGNPVSLFKKSEEPTIDETPPSFSTGYPKTDNVTKNGFDLKVKASEPCTVFYKVVAEGGTAPTKGELMASDKTIAVETGNAEYMEVISELEPETTYNVYLIAKDTADNVQNDSTIVSATTLSAVQKIITLGEISDKYYWGETTRITWTATNFSASTDNDYIILSKDNTQILCQKISITDGEADFMIGNGTAPDENTYGANYKLKIISGNVESELSESFTIVPTITINRLLTDTTDKGESIFKGSIVKVRGMVTGTKKQSSIYENFTIQDTGSYFCATLVLFCTNNSVNVGDSVFAEGLVNYSNGLLRIGKDKNNLSNATKINSGNNLPEPLTLTIPAIRSNKGLMNRILRIENALCKIVDKDKCLFVGTDSIFYNSTLYSGKFDYGRKYNISGALGTGTGKRLELWPRSDVEEDIYLYSNDTTLATFVIGGRDASTGDTLIYNNINIKGISATSTNENASLSIRVNNDIVDTADWANVTLAPLDSVFVTVTAEDGTERTYKRIIDCKTLTFSPLASNSFGTDDVINLSWTSQNISQINLSLYVQTDTIPLTNEAINANLSEWQYIVPDAMFGNGWVKAFCNGVALDSIAVSIADTKAPMVVRQNPANESVGLTNSFYVSMVFDENVVVSEGAKLKVGNVDAAIVAVNDTMVKAFVSGLDYGTEYSAELPDGAVKDLAGNNAVIGNWTFSTRTAPQPELYFSEYAKGSYSNKYYEIYNPCDTAVDLSRYFVTMNDFKSNETLPTLQLSGWLMPNEVLVVANSSAATAIKQNADVSTTKTTTFTGDDLLGLFRKDSADTVLIDVLGPFGNCDTANYWSAAGVEKVSTDHTIVRNVIICGTTDWNESAGTDSLDSQWTVLGKDDWSNLGLHGNGHNVEILRMSIGGIAATINSTEATVSTEVPYGTDLTQLAVSYRTSQGAQIFINDSLAADTIDFSSPVLATVIACDSINQKVWTITVTMAPKPSSDKNILTFSFVETTPVSVTIDTANATIDAVVAFNLDSLKLTSVITIAEFASVSTTLFKSRNRIFTAKTRWDFCEPQTFVVTAEDLTEKNWTVSVEKEPEPQFSFAPLSINTFGTGETISLSWTSINISKINFTLDIQNNTIQLTDSAINADLGKWDLVVPDAVFGEGLVKAVRNGIALDSIAINIADTKAPIVVRQNPANGSAEHANSLYISMVFNENIVVTEGAKLKVGNVEAAIFAVNDTTVKAFVSGLDFRTEYSVELPDGAIKDLAGNNAVIGDWAFSTRTAPQPDLYFSEYAKGSGSNKYYEIYNPCDTAVDLNRYFVTMDNFSSNGSRSQNTLQLSGWLMPNEVLVVANSSAATAIKQNADLSTTKTTTFTGDDLLGLFRKDGSDTVLIDVLGPFGECDAANYWSAAGVEKVSTDHTIVRKVITCGTIHWIESAGTDSLDSQWTVLGKDDWSDIGRHGIGHNADILKMSIGGIEAKIYPAATGVLVEVPYGTDLTQLAVSYRISQGAQMFINDSLATDTVDFSQPVTATVIAGDSVNQKVWTIIVTMAPRPSSDNNILTFSFVETTPISVSIDTTNATIDAFVAYNLDSLKLTPIITIAEFASVSSTLFKSSKRVFTAKTKWDFNEPQTIKVTAEDLTEKVWSVRVDWEKSKELTIKDIAKLDGGLIANIGKPISTEGIVTHIFITSKGAEIHIQDSTGMWSGIMVFDEGCLYAATVAVGDRIKVSGVIAENFGMACIEQIENLEITSNGNRILTDTIIVEDALSTAYQNAIVTIDSVICTGGFESLFTVRDSTNSILIYNKYRISDFTLEIDSMYRITGIVYYTSADNSYRIIPRSADDIVKLVRPQKPEQTKPEEQKPEEQKPQEPDTTTVGIAGTTNIGLTAYTIGRTIVVENADATVTVFDIAGRLIATARPARRIAISAPHSGIYIVGTRQGAIKVRVD